MKRTGIYLVTAVLAGLLLGYLIFGRAGTGETASSEGSVEEGHTHDSSRDSMWTCSMHPNVMQPEPGSCPLCGMDLIPAETGDSMGPQQFRMTENAMALANIRTVLVGMGQDADADDLRLSGTIRENAEANAVQASFFDGRIEKLFVNFPGQQIRKGQRLALIYSPELTAAQQELLTASPLKESQPELYKAVRNKLRNWKLSDSQIDRIEKEGRVTEQFSVNATVSGTVTEVMAREGDYLKAGQAIARLSDLRTVWAELDAFESQLKLLNPGQEIELESNAYPGKTFKAEISFIDPILNANTRTATIRATLQNTEGLFKPGMFISARITSDMDDQAAPLAIPASAVLWTGERSLVYVRVRRNEPVFEMREVQLGSRMGDQYEIMEGLAAGEEIVAEGAFTVDAAAQLKGKKSMMNPQGQGKGPAQNGHMHSGSEDTRPAWPEAMKKAYPNLMNAYLDLKDALVLSDADQAFEVARSWSTSLPTISGEWDTRLQSSLRNMKAHLDRLLEAREDVARQRAEFMQLSNLLIDLGQWQGSTDTLYVQYCPMADDFKGAYWISREEEIRNPYFGDAMLTCGEVEAVWDGSAD